MNANPISAVTLVIANSERLEGRSTSSHVFHEVGGTLGCSTDDDWLLHDHAGRIRPQHAQVSKIDGKFCLIDSSGHTFINRATLPIGRNRKVALSEGDEVLVGEYRLKVHLGDRQSTQPGAQPLASLVNEEQEAVDAYGRPLVQEDQPLRTEAAKKEDPMEALGGVARGVGHEDPMAALDPRSANAQLSESVEDMSELLGSERRVEGSVGRDQQERREGAVRMPAIKRKLGSHSPDSYSPSGYSPSSHSPNGYTAGNQTERSSSMDERAIDDLERSVGEQLEDRWQKPSGRSLGHVGADPLLRGLDIDIPFRDSEEQQAFLEEAGHTLRAAINGLRALQQTQNDSKYPLRDRRLQPIEDNPLRLGQAYEATVETMFSAQRSPVHLSAPEAVGECLRHQGHHQAAVEEAIEYALTAILDAFSPEALLKRFHAYRGAGTRIEDENGWAWEMYRHYYHELNSGRQLGFQKLFWEVFEQAYDQSVRRQQREDA
ncbi:MULTISPECIES: type VI secretion system-associated FHA domain protein TagH [Halomonadaceae]|uniref:Type VI secretion system FHA domain-containing protein n=1 Tax=Vreelandella titanicae TaxID=664683 RepID=A0AAP9T0W2_9GAMM|nr:MULTISPECIES: type VI secretion system-associated FHA domain protein TagH [Halomonas]QKS25257.1 hypothetical protein FX987_03053 [Halomonas titanicae]CDG53593.1 conserved hypothetical protein [Halomonas sp. A3H3]SDJ21276.1 FHA domain protein [Halomonas titanicae]